MRNLTCPYCRFSIRKLGLAGGSELPDLAPLICGKCLITSLYDEGVIRKMTGPEMESLKRSEAWGLLEKIRKVLETMTVEERTA